MEIMKSTTVTVTDVEGLIALRRQDDEIVFDVQPGTVWTPEGIRAIRDALTAVLDEPADTPDMFGPWDRIEDVPASVKKVIDSEGDAWIRRDSDPSGYFAGETFRFINKYAPFTRA